MSLREESVEYIHLPSGAVLPKRNPEPNRTIVIVEQEVTEEWQNAVSQWIVESGCLYMMAWGRDCSSWDDSVDFANLEDFDFGEIPEDRFVLTTWHENELLSEVFFFNETCAWHPEIDLPIVTIIDISPIERREEILSSYDAQRKSLESERSLDVSETGTFTRLRKLVGI